MSLTAMTREVTTGTPYQRQPAVAVRVEKPREDDRREVLTFLAERPPPTVLIAGMITAKGLESPHNRGTFY